MSGDYLPTVAGSGFDLPADGTRASHQIAVGAEADGQESASSQVCRILHHGLRGRYLLATVLGIALGSLLAAGGWLFTEPTYQSQALVRIAQEVPSVMKQQAEYKPTDVFETFMQSQVTLISSAKVVGNALKDPLWDERGLGSTHTTNIDGFANDLKVEHRGGTEHLKISYTARDPVFAATAVQSLVKAYTELYNADDQKTTDQRSKALEMRRAELQKQADQYEKALADAASTYGSPNIGKLYDDAVQRVTRVESALIDVRIALALAQGTKKGIQAKYSPQQIARVDLTMAQYLAKRAELEDSLEQLRLRGFGENHNEVVRLQKQLDTQAAKITAYAREFQQSVAVGAAMPIQATAPQGQFAGMSPEELQASEANLIKLNQESKDQMSSLGMTKMTAEGIQKNMGRTQAEINDIDVKLAELELENGISGRLSVLSNGEVPLWASRDRRPQMATAAGVAGLLVPALGFVLVGVLRRRYRYSADATDDMSSSQIPLLGILPQLPARLTDPESAADAAQCVHQIRVMLQVKSNEKSPVVYHVTSACPGEGKTSLVAALALSYAAAGHQTLVIDADLIGQRLTRGYGLEDKPGFREAIGMQNCSGLEVYPSGVTGLSVLPAGVSDGRDACAVSSGAVRRMLAPLKERFDVILIDSGPILGSLEALVVSGLSDGVILAISREQQKPLVDRAVRQLKSVGARIAGMVFNRAERSDFRRSVGVSSLRSVPRASDTALVKTGVASTSGFGSLVDSVQTYLPTSG